MRERCKFGFVPMWGANPRRCSLTSTDRFGFCHKHGDGLGYDLLKSCFLCGKWGARRGIVWPGAAYLVAPYDLLKKWRKNEPQSYDWFPAAAESDVWTCDECVRSLTPGVWFSGVLRQCSICERGCVEARKLHSYGVAIALRTRPSRTNDGQHERVCEDCVNDYAFDPIEWRMRRIDALPFGVTGFAFSVIPGNNGRTRSGSVHTVQVCSSRSEIHEALAGVWPNNKNSWKKTSMQETLSVAYMNNDRDLAATSVVTLAIDYQARKKRK